MKDSYRFPYIGCTAMSILLATPVGASVADIDRELSNRCLKEVEEMQAQNGVHGPFEVSSSTVRKSDTQAVVEITASTGEGRPITARCVFRSDKLFDLRIS